VSPQSSPKAFRTSLREDLTALLDLLAKGAIKPPIAAYETAGSGLGHEG
jgi:hypothetical protein